MFSFARAAVAAAAVFLGSLGSLGLLTGGCRSDGARDDKPMMSAAAPSTQAVMCSKCQTTWVKVPVADQKGRIVAYSKKQAMVCPDCRDAVQSFFATGKLQHTCKTCGDSMEICEAHP